MRLDRLSAEHEQQHLRTESGLYQTRLSSHVSSAASVTHLQSCAQIGALYLRVRHDGLWCAFADDSARVQTDHTLRKAHDRVHDVLDHDNRDPRFVELETH